MIIVSHNYLMCITSGYSLQQLRRQFSIMLSELQIFCDSFIWVDIGRTSALHSECAPRSARYNNVIPKPNAGLSHLLHSFEIVTTPIFPHRNALLICSETLHGLINRRHCNPLILRPLVPLPLMPVLSSTCLVRLMHYQYGFPSFLDYYRPYA